MQELDQKIGSLDAYLCRLEPHYRSVAQTAVSIIAGEFKRKLDWHTEQIEANQQRLDKHEKRLCRLERELANAKLRIQQLEAERGALCH